MSFSFIPSVRAATIVVPDDYYAIQTAVDAANDGDTIYVRAGVYYEKVKISKSLMLIGENNSTTIIDGNGSEYVIWVKADGTAHDVVIRGFTIQNSGTFEELSAGIRLTYAEHCNISENNVANNKNGIIVQGSSNNTIIRNKINEDSAVGIYLYSSSNNFLSENDITVNENGIELDNSPYNTISENNIVNNYNTGIYVSLYLSQRNEIYRNNITWNDAGILLSMSSHNRISENQIRNNAVGITTFQGGGFIDIFKNNISSNTNGINFGYLDAGNSRVSENEISRNEIGIRISSTNNTLSENDITDNSVGVFVSDASENTVSENNIANNSVGISLNGAGNNTITKNRITNNSYGVSLANAKNNLFFFNILTNNEKSADASHSPYLNIWDNGYSSGGNYWSNYATIYSNATEMDKSGFWNTPYVIGANNTDNYPLMGMFFDFSVSLPYGKTEEVSAISNSTVSNLSLLIWLSSPYNGLEPGQPYIQFASTGSNGTVGFCRLMIPRTVLNSSSYIVLIDTQPVNATELPISNDSCVYLYFTYPHSSHEVIVTIPELSWLILPLFMIAILLTCKVARDNNKREKTGKERYPLLCKV